MPNWTKEQLSAITTRGKNIIVSAGAGSGKTEVLSERVIHNLMNNNIHINEMLILTFTKNAAFEMKERIKKKIKMHDEIKDELKLIDSADITNFDAYTLALVKKYHYMLNLDANLTIIDSSIINKLKKDILNEIFDNKYQENNEKFNNLITSFCNKNDKQIKNIILSLDSKLELLSNKEEYLNTYINNYYSENNLNNLFNEYTNNLLDKINTIKDLLEDIQYETDASFYEKYYNGLLPLINATTYEEIKSSLDIPKTVNRNSTPLGKEIKANITNIIKEIKEATIFSKEALINQVLNTKDNVEIIINIIIELTNKINEFKNENSSYEFNDISKFAINLIKENENIKNDLKYHYKEIMIDEYQDTSDIEEEFINLIENDNVYMVGDIKQSIYRFRNANPNIFKDKYDLYKDGTKGIRIDLNKNFRSREEVLSSINNIFNYIMDNKIGNANYKDEHNLIFGNQTFNIEGKNNNNNNLEIYNYEKNNTNTREEIEAFIIGNDIKNKINNHYEVFDKQIRHCKYSDFCILLDRGSAFNTYKKVFDYLGIPLHIYQDEDILFSSETLLINNIIGFLIKIKNNTFDIETNFYYASIARSYLFEQKDNEIYETIKNHNIRSSIIYETLLPIAKDLDYLSNNDVLIKIIDKLNIYEKLTLVGDINEKSIILNNLITKFEELNNIGIDIYGVNDYLNNLIENKDKIKISASHIAIDSVTLTNIHKSKGLEYKICYFAGYYKKFSTEDIKPKIRYDNKYGIIFPDYDETFIETFISKLSKDNFKIEDISEKIRLLYVALTRCKEKMIIVDSLKEDEGISSSEMVVNNYKRSKYNSFEDILNSIYPHITKYITNIKTPIIDNSYKINKNISIASETSDKIEIIEHNYNIEEIEENNFSKTTNKLFTKEEKNNMEYGTNIHYLLETTDFINPNYNNLTNNEIDIIKSLLNNELFKNIKDANIFKEYEFIEETDNETKTGIIDLMLEYQDHIDIIDYKLKHIDDKAYINQLNGYKNYIYNLTNKPVNTYLYSILDKKLFKLD